MVQRTARCPGVVWPDPVERFPSFLWSLRASPLTLASTLSSPLRENPAETMTFLPGLRRVSFFGQQVAVLLHSVAGPVFPVLSRFNKMTRNLFPQAVAGFVLFCFFLRLCQLADSIYI